MLGWALKIVVPAVIATALAGHGLTGALAGDDAGLTNVTGGPGDCSAPTAHATCAPLFDGHQQLYPGRGESRSVQVAYHGRRAAEVGLYVDNFTAKAAGSLGFCQAVDPASMLDVEITRSGQPVYSGTLSDLAARHGAAIEMIDLGRWDGGRSASFTFTVTLDQAADNSYMGCTSTADFVWIAE